jgi:predicted DNA-binding protein (MmcQ/YjbR family)
VDVEQIRDYCLAMPGVTEDMKWGENLCFSVGGKLFLILGLDHSPVTASFKVPAEAFEEMSRRPGFKQAPYLARGNWVWVEDIGIPGEKNWPNYLQTSYQLILSKLPATVRATITKES